MHLGQGGVGAGTILGYQAMAELVLSVIGVQVHGGNRGLSQEVEEWSGCSCTCFWLFVWGLSLFFLVVG